MHSKVNYIYSELKEILETVSETKEKFENQFLRRQKEQKDINEIKLNSSINELNANVDKLIKLYDKTSNEKDQVNVDPFLYQKSLGAFFKEEEAFTASLTEYTRNQFFGGISDLAGGPRNTKYTMFDANNPQTFLIKDGNGNVREQERLELDRLQSAYLQNKLSCVNNDMSKAKYTKAVEIANRQIKLLKSLNNFDVTNEQLAVKVASLYNQINPCQSKIRNSYGSELLPLLQNLQKLNSTKVIQGDYDLKLMRQDYFISKQNEVIKQLLNQYSRNYLLAYMYEIDLKGHTHNYHMLSTLTTLVSHEIENIEKRISLSNQVIASIKSEKNIIATNDTYLNRIYASIHGRKTDVPELFRSFDNLNSAISSLSRSHNCSMKKFNEIEKEKSDYFKQIKAILTDTETIMKSSKEKANEELSTVTSNFEENLSMTEVQINEVIKDVMEKKNILTLDRAVDIKRNVFSHFFSDPAKLMRNLNELEAKVSSSIVS